MAPVLVVENDTDIRESLIEVMQDAGLEAVGAENGRAAMEWLTRSPTLPSVIFLDLMMPEIDGAAFRRLQRSIPRLREVPVVVISAMWNVRDEARLLDAVSYLTKPLNLKEVLKVARRYTEPRSPAW